MAVQNTSGLCYFPEAAITEAAAETGLQELTRSPQWPGQLRHVKLKQRARLPWQTGTAGSHHASPRLPKMRLHKALQKPATLSSLTQRRISKPDATGSSSQGSLLPCAGARAHAITPCRAGSFGARASPHLPTASPQQGRLSSTEQLCSFDADRCFCSLKITTAEIWSWHCLWL